jgi:hypothetical protein
MPLTYLPFLGAWLAASITIAFGQVGMIISLSVMGFLLLISATDSELFGAMLIGAIPLAILLVVGVSAPVVLAILAGLTFVWYVVLGDAYRPGTFDEQTMYALGECAPTFFVALFPLGIAVFTPGANTTLQIVMFCLAGAGLLLGALSMIIIGVRERSRQVAA